MTASCIIRCLPPISTSGFSARWRSAGASRPNGAGAAPLNAAEGFIRQIIGWREFVRGIYFREGRTTRGATRSDTAAICRAVLGRADADGLHGQAVAQTRSEAYAHHIQRLMVTGNFALLAGVDPQQVHEWYLSVYAMPMNGSRRRTPSA